MHGHEAAAAASEAAEVLFGGDPDGARRRRRWRPSRPRYRCVELPGELDGLRVHELLVAAGVAKSNSEVSRLLGQGAVRAGNRVLDADGLLSASDLLRGRFLLLRKGKRDFVVGKSSTQG